jgi:methylmalonyl-CoA mutase N-terminal domain/subunit
VESALLALRTQQVIASETGVTNTADPVGGSYEIERLTGEIEQGAADYIRRIDEMGGTLRAIERGFIQGEIRNAAYDYQRAVESGRQIVVGMNRFQQQEAARIPTFRVDAALEKAQVERLRQVRASRDRETVERRLDRLTDAARGADNLMPLILDAAAAYATVGEISDRLRSVFGEYREAA